MATPYAAASPALIPPAASSSASPFLPTVEAPRLETPADDSDVDMSQSADSANQDDDEENEEDAEFEMDDQGASEPDSPPVRAPGFAAKQKRSSKKLDLPEFLDADLYGLRRSVSYRCLAVHHRRAPVCGFRGLTFARDQGRASLAQAKVCTTLDY